MSIIMLASVVLVSCKKDDDDDPTPTPTPVEDGIYLVGTATGFEGMILDGMMSPGQVEGDEFASLPREGMFEKFIYLNAGTFYVGVKQGATEEKLGWDAAGAQEMDLAGEESQIFGKVFHGTVENNGTEFTVDAGFYHVVYDETTSKVYYTKIDSWGVIGDATDNGWADEYNMPSKNMSPAEATWEVTDVPIRERGGFKFRYNNGWKISTDDFIIFSNVGKGDTESDWLMGGGTFAYPSAGEGVYTIELNWSLKDGWAFTATKTGDLEPLPEYPAELYMIGASVGGWDWSTVDLPMVPANSNPHLFWKIVWIESGVADPGFKFAPVKDWQGDFGSDGGEAVDGVYNIGSSNVAEPAESGYYMVVVNLLDETIEVNPAMVYGIGDAFGTWDAAQEAAIFTVDNANEVISFNSFPAAGDLRMHVAASTLTNANGDAIEWWQAEFILRDGIIEYRGTGGDQEPRIPVTAGQSISLNFRTNTGSIQ